MICRLCSIVIEHTPNDPTWIKILPLLHIIKRDSFTLFEPYDYYTTEGYSSILCGLETSWKAINPNKK